MVQKEYRAFVFYYPTLLQEVVRNVYGSFLRDVRVRPELVVLVEQSVVREHCLFVKHNEPLGRSWTLNEVQRMIP